ncbi:unnamed protein product [Prorocentrum cordatum]|uniref:Uncharacterized protein n=1 Tax=Prorocentrum cordatum TaxID=2364126 RepID=A0ABN9SWY0_9DINO|nr:unnamed protein product [Polarella glacialis]
MEALTKGIQAAMEKRMQSATKDISELLSSSGDINQNIKDCLSRQDSPLPIMTVLQMNLAKAEKGSQQEKALSYIFNVMNQELLQKKVPTVLKVLSTLLATPEAPVRRKVLKDHLAAMEAEGHRVEADLSSAIVELVREAEVQFTGQNVETPQRVETLELIRRTAIDAGVVIAEVYGDEDSFLEQDMFTNELGPLFEALSRTLRGRDVPAMARGRGGGLPACPSEDQRQAVAALHRRGLAEGLLLLGAGDLEGPLAAAAEAHAAAALVLVRRSAVGTEERLPSGRSLWEVLVGPLPEPAAALAFRRPLALWALDAEPGPGSDAAAAACEETVCIALSPGPEAGGSEAAVAAAMAELQEDGLAVVGLRLAFPDQAAAQAAASVSLRSAVRPGRAVLLLAVRGPHALCVWRSLLGPVDPQLARRTDPASLNARFGGVGRGEAVAFTPPSSSSRALVDVIWGFGGRVDAGSPALPTRPAHAIFLAQPRTYSLELSGQLSFGAAGSVLSGMLFRMGHVVSLTADAAAGTFLATGVREGGSAFAGSCVRLLAAPPADASELAATSPVARRRPVDAIGVAAVPREPPHGLGLALNAAPPPATGPEAEEACRLGDPEPLVLGIRPRGAAAAALLLREVCDDLFAKFGPDGGQSPGSQEARPPGLSAGCGVDLLGVRLFDSRSLADAAAGAGPGAQRALDAGLAALRGFRSFAQVVRRAGDAASDCWWAAAEAGGPAVLLCLRGEGLIERFRSFFAREWKLSAVANGDILFSPDLRAARQARHAFFAGQGRGPVAPTFPPSDLRCPQRFEGAPAREAVPQLTAAVLLPPTVDAALFRVLTAVEQHGFALVAAVASGGLSRPTARLLFDQEVEDGHLEAGDLDAFGAAAGCGAEGPDAEGSFRCVWLLLSRPCAVKRLAQLCGHGDPAVNQRHLYASLRSGRERVQNGIRCATSRASAEALLGTLGDELGAHVAPPGHPGDRRLGVEECERTPECSLVAVALADGSEVAVAHVLRELHVAATGRGLALVGLRALGAGLGPASAVWPGLRGSLPQLLGSWRDARPSAAGVAERARDGGPFLLAVCEGPRCVDHARAALAAVVEAAQGPAGGLEHYASATPGEGAADVAHLFGELFGAKHYVVAGAV